MFLDDFRNYDEDRTIGMLGLDFRDMLQQTPGKAPIWGGRDNQLRRHHAGTLCGALDILPPLSAEPTQMLLGIGAFELGQMHCDDIWRQHQGIAHCLLGKPVPTLQRYDCDRRLQAAKRDRALVSKLAIDHLVITVDRL